MKNVIFKRTVLLGTQEEYGRRGNFQAKVFCRVEIREDGELSISGVIGPYSNGDCAGSCGQIYDSIKIEKYAQGWNKTKVKEFIEVWNKWHLNHMNAACDHQTKENGFDLNREVEIYEYTLKDAVWLQRSKIKKEIDKKILLEGTASIGPADQALLNLPMSVKSHIKADNENYELKKTETKTLRWLSEDEHPEGCLSRACPTCGYKYGTSWLKKELPQEIIDYIHALPAALEPCPWNSI